MLQPVDLSFVWDAGDEAGRRLTAVQLVRIKAASGMDVAAAFGVSVVTLWRWRKELDASGAAGLAWHKRGPKGPSRLSDDMVADIRARRSSGATLQAVADAVGVSVTTVRRALAAPTTAEPAQQEQDQPPATVVDLPVLPAPADRDAERAAARWGKLPHAEPVFAPAAQVPLAGLLLAIPALEATGLLSCATQVLGACPTVSTAWTPCWSRACCGPWPVSPAPKAPPGLTRPRWAGCWGWTGARKSRRFAARSLTLPLPDGPTNCSPRWHDGT